MCGIPVVIMAIATFVEYDFRHTCMLEIMRLSNHRLRVCASSFVRARIVLRVHKNIQYVLSMCKHS